MMRATIRNGKESVHLIGHCDPYNLESLRDHAHAMGREGGLSLLIEVSPHDEAMLSRQAGAWLARLASSGVPVTVRPATNPLG